MLYQFDRISTHVTFCFCTLHQTRDIVRRMYRVLLQRICTQFFASLTPFFLFVSLRLFTNSSIETKKLKSLERKSNIFCSLLRNKNQYNVDTRTLNCFKFLLHIRLGSAGVRIALSNVWTERNSNTTANKYVEKFASKIKQQTKKETFSVHIYICSFVGDFFVFFIVLVLAIFVFDFVASTANADWTHT